MARCLCHPSIIRSMNIFSFWKVSSLDQKSLQYYRRFRTFLNFFFSLYHLKTAWHLVCQNMWNLQIFAELILVKKKVCFQARLDFINIMELIFRMYRFGRLFQRKLLSVFSNWGICKRILFSLRFWHFLLSNQLIFASLLLDCVV